MADVISTTRSSSLYQLRTVTVVQPVAASRSAWAKVGSRLPFRRGRPVCRGSRGGAGSYSAASSRKRVMPQMGLGSWRSAPQQRNDREAAIGDEQPGGARAASAARPGASVAPSRSASYAAGLVPDGSARRAPGPSRTARPRRAWPREWGPSSIRLNQRNPLALTRWL